MLLIAPNDAHTPLLLSLISRPCTQMGKRLAETQPNRFSFSSDTTGTARHATPTVAPRKINVSESTISSLLQERVLEMSHVMRSFPPQHF